MVIKLQDEITGRWYTTCMIWRCRNNAFKKWAGIVYCRKHYKYNLIKNYGNYKTAAKYGHTIK